MTDYKATPEQWADTEYWAHQDGNAQACILELRARVEALEARRPASKVYEINKPLKLTPRQQEEIAALPAVKGPLLVTRVAAAISQDGEPINWPGAYAAIREVAAWLREHYGGPTASSTALEREVQR